MRKSFGGRKVWPALALAASIFGCAEEADEASDASSTEGVQQQVTVTEPLRGMYHADAPNGPNLTDATASWLGREHDVALAFAPRASWSDLSGPSWQLPAWGKWVKAKAGRRLVYSLALLPDNTPDASLQKCADGAYDQTWKTLANNLVANGLGATILRLGWEFDGAWFAWSAIGKEAQFAGCFRRVVTTMRAAQPTARFEYDWNPTEDIANWTSAQIDGAWPGDAYVDYVGVDAYDTSWAANSFPYPASCDASCRSTRQSNAWNDLSRGLYRMRDLAIAHGKRVSIPEWGVWTRPDGHGGDDDPLYVQKMYAFMADAANRVAYQIYFDVNAPDGSHQISDVSGDGAGTSVGHTFKTAFPSAAAKYRASFAAITSPTPTPTPTGNLALLNPGFEAGATGWNLYGSALIGNVGTNAGNGDLQIAGASGGAEQDVIALVTPGASYQLSAYARLYKVGDLAAIGVKFLSASGSVLDERYAQITSTRFSKRTLTFSVPQGATRALIYAFKQKGSQSGALFDDFTLTRS